MIFAADLPARVTARMAAVQRPISLAASEEKSTELAWKTISSGYLIGRQDQIFTARRSGSWRGAPTHASPRSARHASYLSCTGKVTEVILRAARSAG